MNEQVTTRKSVPQLLYRLLFLVVPTLLVGYKTLESLNQYYSEISAGVLWQSISLGLGLTAAFILYFYRARFIITFPILLLIYWLLKIMVSRMPGEIDVFEYTVKFKLYSVLFIYGWLFGFLLVRVKYAYVVIAGILAVIAVVSISKEYDMSFGFYLERLIPVVAYTVYMLFIAPSLSESMDLDLKKSGKKFGFALFFLGLVVLAYWGAFELTEKDRNTRERILGEKGLLPGNKGEDGKEKKEGYNEKDGLLERGDKDGKGKGGKKPGDDGEGGNKPGEDGEDGYKPKDTMKMSDKMSQADYIMFCAKVKNYFPDGTPKPLYFVYHYLTKYDPVKESFIRDTAMPHFDELKCDPSALPMYRSKTDSTVIKNTLATKKMSVITSEVYVSSNTWKHAMLAPASAFYCQTIPVDSGYKKMFRSAYKVKSYTSELNNAYFVYNPSANPQLADYQEERYDELRSVKDYSRTEPDLFRYYTQMPKGPLYDSIDALAKRITKDAVTPIDKVIAIRDYFLQTDKEGNRIYRYSLKAGVPSDPNIPNSSMLRNFLFKTHVGYCTYYAGASLFLLRSVGIPARFTTGFATIDRSDKNKGWYWFYASQAHAWTQVYFPEYGWLDFDMTIGNDDQREAPRPDGTPPLPPPEPWLVLDGKAEAAPDMQAKRLDVSFQRLVFFNDDFRLQEPVTRTIDASVCRVLYGKKDTTLSCIKPGDSLVIVSYDDAAKKVPVPDASKSIDEQVAGFPKPIIADEIHIKVREEDRTQEEKKKEEQKNKDESTSAKTIGIIIGLIVGLLIAIPLGFPRFWRFWLQLRVRTASDPKSKADWVYRMALYEFHMSGIERGHETPLEYAMTKTDPIFGVNFTRFMQMYLRMKYTNRTLLPGDKEIIDEMGRSIRPAVRKKFGRIKTYYKFYNISRALRFFRRPEANPQEEQQSPL